MMIELKNTVEEAWENRELLKNVNTQEAIREVINLIDLGQLRCAEPTANGWKINEWVKKGVVLYFPIQKMEILEAGIFEYHDKIPLKRGSQYQQWLYWRQFVRGHQSQSGRLLRSLCR